MSTVLCDLGAWITYASRAPLTPIPKEEADRVLREATCTARQAAAVREAPWYSPMVPLGRILAGLPGSQQLPLHVVVGSNSLRHTIKGVRAHQVRKPDQTLIPATDGMLLHVDAPPGPDGPVYVVAPPLYLLLRARFLDLATLVAVGCVLCGSYDRRPDLREKLVTRPPRTTPHTLRSFAASIPSHVKGRSLLRQAASLTTACSRSPMETALAVMLSLPVREGGYGFPLPELNPPLDLGEDGRRVMGGQRRIYADLFWREAGLGVEYDSAEYHSDEAKKRADERRVLAADVAGVEIVSWVPEVVNDEVAFSLACERLAHRLSVPFSWDTRYVEQRRSLRARMLVPHLFW